MKNSNPISSNRTRFSRYYGERYIVSLSHISLATAVAVGLGCGIGSAQGGITLVDQPLVNASTSGAAIVNSTLNVSPAANTLVVEVTAEGTNQTPTVSFNGLTLTKAAGQTSVPNNTLVSDIYYLFNPPSGAADQLSVNLINGTGGYAIQAFTLGGVNVSAAPNTTAGWNGVAATPTTAANFQTVSLNNIPTGAWAVTQSTYYSGGTGDGGSNNLLTASTTAGTLTTTGPNGAAVNATGNYFDNNVQGNSQSVYAGAIIQNISSSSLTVTETAGAPPGTNGPHFTSVGAIFSPAGPALTWTGSDGFPGSGTWVNDGSNTSWIVTGDATKTPVAYTDGSPVTFDDSSSHGNVTINSPGVAPNSITFANSMMIYTLSGSPITGSGPLNVAGGGVVHLSSSNTYTGGTSVSNGTLFADNNNALSTGPIVVTSGGFLNFTSATPTVGSLAGNGTVILGPSSAGTTALTVTTAIAPTTFSGPIQDAGAGRIGSLTVAGTSILTLSGSNTFSGGTTVNSGATLKAGSAGGLSNAGTITLVSGGTLDFNGQVMSPTTPAITSVSGSGVGGIGEIVNNSATPANYGGAITLTGSTTVGGTGSLTLSGAIAGPGVVLTKVGVGTLVLSGNNTFSGGLALNAGTLDLGGVSPSIPALTGAADATITNSGAPATLVLNSPSNSFGGNITDGGSGNSLALSVGAGSTLTLTGAGTFVGGTTIANGGRVNANAASALGTGPVTINAGGTLSIGNQGGYLPLLAPATGLNVATNFTLNGNAKTGNGTNGLSGGILQLTNGGGQASSAFLTAHQSLANLTNATGFTVNFTYKETNIGTSAPGDGVAFVMQNNGPTSLGGGGGGYGYSGITNSFAFILNADNHNILAGTGGTTNNLQNQVATGTVNIDSGDPINVTLTYNGATHSLGETLIDPTAGTTFTLGTPVTVNIGQALAGGTGSINSFYTGFSAGSGGNQAIQQISNFTFASGPIITNAASIANPVNVVGSSTLENNVGAGVVLTVGPVNFAGGSTLNITAGATIPGNTPYGVVGGASTLAGNATVNVANNGTGVGILTLGAVGDGGGGFGLTKIGAGALLLNSNNTYTGLTNVQAGALGGKGSIGTSKTTAVIATSGATLAPSALQTVAVGGASQFTITGAVSITGGTLGASLAHPDNALSLGGGGNAGVDYDLTLYTGSFALSNAVLSVNDTTYATGSPAPKVGDKFYIVDAALFSGSSNVTGTFSNLTGGQFTSANNITYSVALDQAGDPTGGGQDVLLTVQSIAAPEPASLGLLGLGAIGLLARRRRRTA